MAFIINRIKIHLKLIDRVKNKIKQKKMVTCVCVCVDRGESKPEFLSLEGRSREIPFCIRPTVKLLGIMPKTCTTTERQLRMWDKYLSV